VIGRVLATTILRPSNVSFTGTATHANDAYAYDADPATAGTITAAATLSLKMGQNTYTGFGSGTRSGTLTVDGVFNTDRTDPDAVGDTTESYITVMYKTTNAGSWVSLRSYSPTLVGATGAYADKAQVVLSNVDVSQLSVLVTVSNSYVDFTGDGGSKLSAYALASIKDINFSF
jgi:hypothetical protein